MPKITIPPQKSDMWALFGQIETARRVTWYGLFDYCLLQSVSDSLWHLNAAHSNTSHSRGLGNDEEQEQADQVPRRMLALLSR